MNYKTVRYILEQDRRYSSVEKMNVRDYLIKKYILPKVKKGKEVSVLDFFGTGQFVERVIEKVDQARTVKNQSNYVNLYEIESDNKLQGYMRWFVDHCKCVKNHYDDVNIIPFYGSLQDFVHNIDVQNQSYVDLIFADYCGMVTEKDIKVLKPIANIHTAIVITVYLTHIPRHIPKTLKRVDNMVENVFRKNFPLFNAKRMRGGKYKSMAVYEARVPYKIRKGVSDNVFTNTTTTGTAYEIPSI